MDFVLDEKNKRILTMLKNDSRKSFTDIAKELELSEGAIRKRIKSLVQSRIIEKFTIETNESVYPLRSVVMVKLSIKAPLDKLVEFIRQISGVHSAYAITGGYDIFVDMGAKTPNELQEKITSIRNQKGVASTLTMTILG